MLRHGTSVFKVISERPVILTSKCRALGEGAITTYFNVLGLTRPGAEHGARTHDLPITRRELYQLSHCDRSHLVLINYRKWHWSFVDEIHFCQNKIHFCRQNSISSWQNSISVNYMYETNLHTKLTNFHWITIWETNLNSYTKRKLKFLRPLYSK